MTLPEATSTAWLPRLGLRLSDWFERWFPDAFALALAAVTIVFLACVAIGSPVVDTAAAFGDGFWDLVPFTMQMTMIIVSGYAVATAPPVSAAIRRLAVLPKTGRGAVAFVALFSMLSSLVSWSFSIIFSGLLAREVARRQPHADYRALGAAAYLGIGSIWALGLSSSAALLMATPGSLPEAIGSISGIVPLSQTIGLWQNVLMAGLLVIASVGLAYYSAPAPGQARSMASMAIAAEAGADAGAGTGRPATPGEWLEYSPLLTVVVGSLGLAFLAREVAGGGPSVLLQLNHYIFTFLVIGLWLHWRPRSFMHAVQGSVPAAAGVLIQFPFYAGIVTMMTASGLTERLARAFVTISTAHTYPILVGIYSAVLGLFIPSGGGKWVVEAPYLMEAARSLEVHLGWVVQTYNATETLANLIHPFWMLPLLGILGLKAREIVGYSTLQFAVHVPLVLFLVWALNYTLAYIPPVVP